MLEFFYNRNRYIVKRLRGVKLEKVAKEIYLLLFNQSIG